MSGTNQAPPPPTDRKPLKQSMADIRSNKVAPPVAPPIPKKESAPSKFKKNTQAEQQETQSTQNHGVPEAPSPNKKTVNYNEENYFAPTYYEGGDDVGGYIEFDLQRYRQKGVEERFLSVSVMGLLEDLDVDDQDIASQAVNNVAKNSMRISNKKQFDALKEFFLNLEWEE